MEEMQIFDFLIENMKKPYYMKFTITVSLLEKIFEHYGNFQDNIIDKHIIEKILHILSVHLCYPSKFEFEDEKISFEQVCTKITQLFRMKKKNNHYLLLLIIFHLIRIPIFSKT